MRVLLSESARDRWRLDSGMQAAVAEIGSVGEIEMIDRQSKPQKVKPSGRVSQLRPAGLSMRSQASCTISSASAKLPVIRYAGRRVWIGRARGGEICVVGC